MLKQIYIKNFTIISELNLELADGLSILTGETGAGKSIILDALTMVLGGRADTQIIRHQTERCEISVCFYINRNEKVQHWLLDHELTQDDECIISRIITRDGRSKNIINGRPCTLQQVRELGELLIHIHSQNQHYALLKNEYQRELLDAFAQNHEFCTAIANVYHQWQTLNHNLHALKNSNLNKQSQMELFKFQLSELEKLNLRPSEVSALENEHRQLSNAEQLINRCQQAVLLLEEDERTAVLKQLHLVLNQLTGLVNIDSKFQNSAQLIQNALIHTQEAIDELRHYLDNFNLDPERLKHIDQKLSNLHDLARKHRVKPEELCTLQEHIQNELELLENTDQSILQLENEIAKLSAEYQGIAKKLSETRTLAAKKLQTIVNKHLAHLNLPHGQFQAQLQPSPQFTTYGFEHIEFLISTNPGQPLQALNKIASGGELSRIALAIQVATAQTNTTPTLIFDEVDVGIGGGTAEIVGRLLKTLANNAQILCITHLPQVAAQGHQHLQILKTADKGVTETGIRLLSTEERILEIARMLGGVKITETTLQHATELLNMSMFETA